MGLANHGRQSSTRASEVECASMIEESPESFISRWRAHAADVELFPRTEGSPLLEALAGDALVHLFERTGPYLGRPGPAKVIIQPVTDGMEHAEDGSVLGVEVTGLGRFVACGRVLEVEGRIVVVDAGVPLVVALLDLEPPEDEGPRWEGHRRQEAHVQPFRPGELVRFTNLPPAHGFVVPQDRRSGGRRQHEHHDDSI